MRIVKWMKNGLLFHIVNKLMYIMISEIDASAIIAHLVTKSKENVVVIKRERVIEIGGMIEQRHPSVVIDTDRYAFHAFQRFCNDDILNPGSNIVVNKNDSFIQKRLQRILPSLKVRNYIDDIVD